MALLSDIRLNEDITELISDGLINDSSTSEITTWSSSKTDTTKQDVLVSTTNIKTINSNSILGSGDLEVTGMRGNALFVMATDPTLTEDVETNDIWIQIP